MTKEECIDKIKSLVFKWSFGPSMVGKENLTLTESVGSLIMGPEPHVIDSDPETSEPNLPYYEDADSGYIRICDLVKDATYLLQLQYLHHQHNAEVYRYDGEKINNNTEEYQYKLQLLNQGYNYISAFFDGIANAFRKLLRQLIQTHVPYGDDNVESDPALSGILFGLYREFLETIYRYAIQEQDEDPRFYHLTFNEEESQNFGFENLTAGVENTIPAIEQTLHVLFKNCFSPLPKDFIDAVQALAPDINTKYIEGRSCFSITEIKTWYYKKKVVYCISGVNPPNKDDLDKDMDKILQYLRRFCTHHVTLLYMGFQPQYMDEVVFIAKKNIPVYYKDFLTTEYNLQTNERMFSCCEKKTYAFVNTRYKRKTIFFQMFVKWVPCNLCVPISNHYMRAWNGTIVTGRNVVYDVLNPCVKGKSIRREQEFVDIGNIIVDRFGGSPLFHD